MIDTILNRICEISGMCFSILASLLTNGSPALSWEEAGSQMMFAFTTGIVGGVVGLIVKLIWNKVHNNQGSRKSNK